MSTAAAVEGAVPVKAGKKKLIIIVVAALVLLAAVGGGAVFWLKTKAHAAQEAEDADDEGGAAAHATAAPKRDPKAVPVFVPLDHFTVNLADREAERYAQIGISLELNDAKAGEQDQGLHAGHPQQHPDGAGAQDARPTCWNARARKSWPKRSCAKPSARLACETARPRGAAKKGEDEEPRPVRAVHFSNFIIQ